MYFLDKILKYALRNKEHGILRKKDFQFMVTFCRQTGTCRAEDRDPFCQSAV